MLSMHRDAMQVAVQLALYATMLASVLQVSLLAVLVQLLVGSQQQDKGLCLVLST